MPLTNTKDRKSTEKLKAKDEILHKAKQSKTGKEKCLVNGEIVRKAERERQQK